MGRTEVHLLQPDDTSQKVEGSNPVGKLSNMCLFSIFYLLYAYWLARLHGTVEVKKRLKPC